MTTKAMTEEQAKFKEYLAKKAAAAATSAPAPIAAPIQKAISTPAPAPKVEAAVVEDDDAEYADFRREQNEKLEREARERAEFEAFKKAKEAAKQTVPASSPVAAQAPEAPAKPKATKAKATEKPVIPAVVETTTVQNAPAPTQNAVVPRASFQPSNDVADLGLAGELSMDDCERGRLFVMQSTSELVKARGAFAGDIVNLADGTKLADDKQALEFIPVSVLKFWVETYADKDREFICKYPGINEKEKEWEGTLNGRPIKRLFTLSYLFVLPEDLKNGMEIPYEFSFRSTSLRVAKSFNNIIMKMASQQIPSWGKTFLMTTELMNKGKDSWYIPKISIGRDATAQEQATVRNLRDQFNILKQKMMQEQEIVAHTDYVDTTSVASSAPAQENVEY